MLGFSIGINTAEKKIIIYTYVTPPPNVIIRLERNDSGVNDDENDFVWNYYYIILLLLCIYYIYLYKWSRRRVVLCVRPNNNISFKHYTLVNK